jgi:hypothetical protein
MSSNCLIKVSKVESIKKVYYNDYLNEIFIYYKDMFFIDCFRNGPFEDWSISAPHYEAIVDRALEIGIKNFIKESTLLGDL